MKITSQNIKLTDGNGKILLDAPSWLLLKKQELYSAIVSQELRIPVHELRPGRYIFTIDPKQEIEIMSEEDEEALGEDA